MKLQGFFFFFFFFFFFSAVKLENFSRIVFLFFLNFAQNIEAVLTSTNNLCSGAKVRKLGIPQHTPVLLYKTGFEVVFISRACFPDEKVF